MISVFNTADAKMKKSEPESAINTPSKIWNVGVKTVVFFDPLRERPLITEVMYPIDYQGKNKTTSDVWVQPPAIRDAALLSTIPSKERVWKGDQKVPLIIFSHEDGGSRLETTWLMYALAQQGYVVASVDHYGNTSYLNQPREALKRWERPKDVSFLITQLSRHPFFRSKIDPKQVGFVGFSVGGLTGVWLAGGKANLYRKPQQGTSPAIELTNDSDQEFIDSINYAPAKQSYQDPNIKAVFLMAPAYGFAFDQAGLKDIKIPVMIVAGEGDTVTPPKENAEYMSKWIPQSVLKILPGKTDHFVFFNLPSESGLKTLPKNWVENNSEVSREAVHKEVEDMAVKFFKENLKR